MPNAEPKGSVLVAPGQDPNVVKAAADLAALGKRKSRRNNRKNSRRASRKNSRKNSRKSRKNRKNRSRKA
jgi:hypothetical protein